MSSVRKLLDFTSPLVIGATLFATAPGAFAMMKGEGEEELAVSATIAKTL